MAPGRHPERGGDRLARLPEPFEMRRLGVVMEPARDDPNEAEGVLNPAAARGPDGHLYLFPRLVGMGNYSRIGIARVIFDGSGDPRGVERLGIALEPAENYEKNPATGGGCEDPRVSFIRPLGCYVMAYTAYGPDGPRIALAASDDLTRWDRLGLVEFGETAPVNFNNIYNKDGVLFPELVLGPDDQPSVGLIHRPLFPGSQPHEVIEHEDPETRKPRLHHESIWISYCRKPDAPLDLCHMEEHHRLMSPRYSWERIKVGAGSPPLLTEHGWLLLYHGVSGRLDDAKQRLRYSAGALVLDRQHPDHIHYRSRQPVLVPDADEREGLVPNVVFPTAVDQRTDIGRPDRVDVYYGMADDRIGVATLTIPAELPETDESSEDRRDAA
ncbi:MAG: glycosidase [Chloroflexi bacterium]|nr:glycosidase [Chloroflexota bacterium]